MSQLIEYKGYSGSVEYSDEDNCFFGKVQSIKSLILYEGQTIQELNKDFQEAVDDYLKICKEHNMEPEKPSKGSFNPSQPQN